MDTQGDPEGAWRDAYDNATSIRGYWCVPENPCRRTDILMARNHRRPRTGDRSGHGNGAHHMDERSLFWPIRH
jgi:hypothetical protein